MRYRMLRTVDEAINGTCCLASCIIYSVAIAVFVGLVILAGRWLGW